MRGEMRHKQRRIIYNDDGCGPLTIATDDDEDNRDDSFYGMAQMKLGNLWVGFLNTLHQVSNTRDVRLV